MANELDLPPISIGRYVDLLKRRRWQVVPISLAGLLLGGIVAFFIPRYYVAETLIGYKALPKADDKERATADPIADELGRYKNIVPTYIPDVLQKLKWPEVLTDDADARKGFEAAVRERVGFQDVGLQDRNRTETQIRLTYRDVDGLRSAEFLNALRDEWAIRIKTELRTRYDSKMALLLHERSEAEQRTKQIADARAAYIQAHGLNAQDLSQNLGEKQTVTINSQAGGLTVQAQESERRINTLEAQIAELEAKIPLLKEQLGSIPPYRDVPVQISPENQKRLDLAVQEYLARKRALERLSDENPQKRMLQRQLEKAEDDKNVIMAEIEGLKPGKVQNPEYLDCKAEIRKAGADLESKKGLLLLEKDTREKLRKQISEMATAMRDIGEQDAKWTQARLQWDKAEEKYRQTTIERMAIETQEAFQVFVLATPPKRPTEPNIMLVALAGCALGLAAAVVLVLLLDMLRSTFKTVDDVERGLAVPVLGSLAHMETREEQHQAQRKRARASLVAASFLTLLAAVVTIYYVAPARLPAVMQKALTYVLGPIK